MARRHFDKIGFPKLDLIVKEICEYVAGLEVAYGKRQSIGTIIDTTSRDRTILHYPVFLKNKRSSKHSFKVKGIYVVGGQVDYMIQGNYNRGPHDLDMKVITNICQLTTENLERDIIGELNGFLNNGKKFSYERNKSKKFILDILVTNKNSIKSPYVQLYPSQN